MNETSVLSTIFVFPDHRRHWDERLRSMIARLLRGPFWQKHRQTSVNCCKRIEIRKNARFKSSNVTGKLKGYLFQLTKLWEELVVLTAKLKKPQSQKKEKTRRNLENGKLCQNVNVQILFFPFEPCR